jgi:hypothetical protein
MENFTLLPLLLLSFFVHLCSAQNNATTHTLFNASIPVTTVLINDTKGLRSVAYYVSSGLAIIDGDVVYGTTAEFNNVIVHTGIAQRDELLREARKQRRANSIFANSGQLWPGGVIKYKYDTPATETKLQQRIKEAIARWTSVVPCISFVQQPSSTTPSSDVVTVIDGDGCYATVAGDVPGVSKWMSPCGVNEATHEWGHVLGLHHEQKRHDREFYTHFKCENVVDYPFNVPLSDVKEKCCGKTDHCCGQACQFVSFSIFILLHDTESTQTDQTTFGDLGDRPVDLLELLRPRKRRKVRPRLAHALPPQLLREARHRSAHGRAHQQPLEPQRRRHCSHQRALRLRWQRAQPDTRWYLSHLVQTAPEHLPPAQRADVHLPQPGARNPAQLLRVQAGIQVGRAEHGHHETLAAAGHWTGTQGVGR